MNQPLQRYTIYREMIADKKNECYVDAELVIEPDSKGEWVKFSDLPPSLSVKPLEWEDHESVSFVTIFGVTMYPIAEQNGFWFIDIGPSAADWIKCESRDHGKQLAQLHWEGPEGIGRFLERKEV